MDDASRFITCYGVFDSATTENTIKVLEKEFKKYGIPDEILTDHGTQFVPLRRREELKKFGSVEAAVKWHNEVEPHRSLDWGRFVGRWN